MADCLDEEKIEMENSAYQLEHGRAQMKEDPIQESVTRAEMQASTIEKVGKLNTCSNTSMFTDLVKDKLIDNLEIEYDVTVKKTKTHLFKQVTEGIAETIQQKIRDSILMRDVDHLTQFESSWAHLGYRWRGM